VRQLRRGAPPRAPLFAHRDHIHSEYAQEYVTYMTRTGRVKAVFRNGLMVLVEFETIPFQLLQPDIQNTAPSRILLFQRDCLIPSPLPPPSRVPSPAERTQGGGGGNREGGMGRGGGGGGGGVTK